MRMMFGVSASFMLAGINADDVHQILKLMTIYIRYLETELQKWAKKPQMSIDFLQNIIYLSY